MGIDAYVPVVCEKHNYTTTCLQMLCNKALVCAINTSTLQTVQQDDLQFKDYVKI